MEHSRKDIPKHSRLTAFALVAAFLSFLSIQGCSSKKPSDEPPLDPDATLSAPEVDASATPEPAPESVPATLPGKHHHRRAHSKAPQADPVPSLAAAVESAPQPVTEPAPPPEPTPVPAPPKVRPIAAVTPPAPQEPVYMQLLNNILNNRMYSAGLAGFFLILAAYFTFKKKRY